MAKILNFLKLGREFSVFPERHDVPFSSHGGGDAGFWSMNKPDKRQAAQTNNVFQFTLAGLIVFSVALISSASFIAFKLTAVSHSKLADAFAVDPNDKSRTIHMGAWGTMITRDIELERPAEYFTDEVNHPPEEKWRFNGLKPDGVRELLAKDGLSGTQVSAVLAPANVTTDTAGTTVRPSGYFLEGLDAGTRGHLYLALAGSGVNTYIDYPYIFPGDKIAAIYADARLYPEDATLLKKLVYPNGSAVQLGDYEYLLNRVPTAERRIALTRALSRQSAVFAGLVIKPDSDIDKIAAYWGNIPNVRFTDIRPLMEALKELPEGGNLSLFYLLPKFARDRLYTFPLPPQPGEPTMDCHWTTFNFSNDTPDNRFNDPGFAVEYIRKNYYQISAPSIYGDILLLMNERDEVKHSAVFLADDLVFTKNGNNYRQPWMIMHIPDLLATYPASPPMKAIYMRLKTD